MFTEYQSWCTVDRKPAMLSTFVEEACEMKLLYLGENLYGELHKKPFHVPPPPFDLDHIQLARRLERDHNILEMYIVHTQASDLNQYNQNIVWDVQNYVSPTDITCVMGQTPTVFDTNFLPEPKTESPTTGYVLNETLGSSLGEITFPAPGYHVKIELPEYEETVGDILTKHSPG